MSPYFPHNFHLKFILNDKRSFFFFFFLFIIISAKQTSNKIIQLSINIQLEKLNMHFSITPSIISQNGCLFEGNEKIFGLAASLAADCFELISAAYPLRTLTSIMPRSMRLRRSSCLPREFSSCTQMEKEESKKKKATIRKAITLIA